MTLDQIAQLAAVFSISAPLCALAWAAVAFVRLRQRELQRDRYQRFCEVMDQLGQRGGSAASQMAAVYELRKFPDYGDVILRLFDQVEVDGHSAPMLKSEMALTADFIRRKARP